MSYWITGATSPTGGSGMAINIDGAPTDITSSNTAGYLVSDTPVGKEITTLTPTDTGMTTQGVWQIDSQSNANLFTLQYDPATGNTAKLLLNSSGFPEDGQQVSVTVHYYDLFQTDSSGTPISGQGVTRNLTFTTKGPSNDLADFGNDISVSSLAGDTAKQAAPSIATLSNGHFVIAWADDTNGGIYTRICDSAGVSQGNALAVDTTGYQPTIVSLAGGKYAVVYVKDLTSNDIAYRIIGADGSVGSEQTIASGTWDGWSPIGAASTSDGGKFIATWNESDYSTIKSATFSNAGVQQGSIATLTSTGYSPSLAILTNGAVVTANVDVGFSGFNITIDDNATVEASDFINGGSPIGDTANPVGIAALKNGNFVVTWDTASGDHINAQVFDSTGSAVSSVIQVETKTPVSGYYVAQPKVTAMDDGGFGIVWYSSEGDGSGTSVQGRRFDANGTAVDATEFQVNQYRYGDQAYSVITALADGGFAVAWIDSASGKTTGDDIEARVLTGTPSIQTISINDVILSEGNSGTQTLQFTVDRTNPAGTLTVDYATANNTATAGSDYVAASGTLSFADGEASKTISVTINGDTTPEDNETFFVNLSNASTGVIADGQGQGTITNDDNHLPVVTAGGTTAFPEQTATAAAPTVMVNDIDGDAGWNGGTLKVQITGNSSADDSLSLPTTNTGGIWLNAGNSDLMNGVTIIGSASATSVSGGTEWALTFNGNATTALVQSVARTVLFDNDSDEPSTASRTITFTATDNASGSGSATQTVTVTPVNDAPQVTNTADPALQFSGAPTSYAQFPDVDAGIVASQAVTLEGWVYFSNLTGVQFIASGGNPGLLNHLELHTNGAALRFIPTQNAFFDTGNVLTAGQWTHIAATYNATIDTAKVYINGTEVSATDASATTDSALQNGTSYYLGKRSDNSHPLNGAIAEFRLWSDVRTADEIRNNMNVGLTGTEDNLVSLWKLDEATGTSLADSTANHFDGTANSASWMTRAVSGGLAVNYTEGSAPVSLFSGATVSTVESGQRIIALTLTVANVSDTTERLAIDGSTIDLVNSSGTTTINGVTYNVTVAAGTATVSLSKAAGLTTEQTAALINGITYSNDSDGPTTTSPRVVALTAMQDNGGGSDTAALDFASTVTVIGTNDAPTNIALSANSISTFDASDTTIGTLSTTDVDSSSFTYSVVSVNGETSGATFDLFNVSGTALRATTPTTLTAGDYTLVVRTDDGSGGTFDKTLTLTASSNLVVTTNSDSGDDATTGGTYAAELADGSGLSLREALALASTGNKTVGFSAALNGQTITLGSSATVPTATTLDADSAGSLTIGGPSLALASALTVTNGVGDQLAINSALTGAGSSLTKTGAGTLVLSGTNTYTGTTTVSGGTLQTNSLGSTSGLNLDGGTLKTLSTSWSSSVAIAVGGSGGTFDLSNGSMFLWGVVSGSGALIVNSTNAGNAITLGANNTYSGGTTLNSGIPHLASNTAIGFGALTVNGGKIRSMTSDFTLDNNLILGGTLTMSGSYALTFNGTVDLGGAMRTINNSLSTPALTLNGAVSNGNLVVSNQFGGTLVLVGNNSYASTTISTGTLSIAGDANLGWGSVTLDGSTSKLLVTGAGTIDNGCFS